MVTVKSKSQPIQLKKLVPSILKRVIALDSETTGLDFRHGTKPFLVTICDRDRPLEPDYWQWRVDPLTREPIIPKGDIEEIKDRIFTADQIVMQNGKFDVNALASIDSSMGKEWPWSKTDDTLLMAHLLASNRPKDLFTLGAVYLGIDMTVYETKLHQACEQARRYCRSRLKNWRITKKGEEDMPSAKDKSWKADTWLPRAVIYEIGLDALNEHYGEDLGWWETVTADYANVDSALTCALLPVMMSKIRERKLDKIYNLYRKRFMEVAYKMEANGVTVSSQRLDDLEADYAESSESATRVCESIAQEYGYDLKLPAGSSVSDNLRTFVYDHLKLEKVYNPKNRKTDNPTLDSKNAIPHYLDTLPTKSKARLFIKTLSGKRSRDTARTFMRMYRRFWQPVQGVADFFRLHPNYKPTATDTLRWGCDNPAVQNISKRENFNLRYCFGPAPGREWWSLDAKNIELRLPFYESGEQLLIDLFERSDDPPFYGSNHLLNFSVIYPDIWDAAVKKVGLDKAGPYCKKEYKDTYYQWCKNGNFAIQYGAVDKVGGGGTADRAFHKNGAHALLKTRFRNLEVLNRRCIEQANKYGYVETIPDRTVDPERGYPLLCTRTEYGGILETVPLSYRIQGSAMWWTGKAQIRCQDKLEQWNANGFDGFITLQVHDELVFDFPLSQIDPKIHMEMDKAGTPIEHISNHEKSKSNWWRIKILSELMAQGGNDFITPATPNGIPTPVGIERHTVSWSEGETYQ